MELGQLYICKDFFLLFFGDKDQAENYASRYMGDDFYMTLREANYELGDYFFSSGIADTADVYKAGETILLLQAEAKALDNFLCKSYCLHEVIWNEKVGWMPLYDDSFEKYFTKLR